MMNEIDLKAFSYPELGELKALVEARMDSLREEGCRHCGSALPRRRPHLA
jgi:hypothetical protein